MAQSLPVTWPTLSSASRHAVPARDSLIKKGLVYSAERGTIAFTVPHFGTFLRAQPLCCRIGSALVR